MKTKKTYRGARRAAAKNLYREPERRVIGSFAEFWQGRNDDQHAKAFAADQKRAAMRRGDKEAERADQAAA